MKKYLFLLVCCVMLALTGCSKMKIVGEWELTGFVVNGEEKTLQEMGYTEAKAEAFKLVIEKDGTGNYAGLGITWKKDGKNYVLSALGVEVKVEIEGKTMKFYDFPNDNSYTIYTKK